MNFHLFAIFICLCGVLSPAVAHSGDNDIKTREAQVTAKDNNVLISEMLKMQKETPDANPNWVRGESLLDWRLIDRADQTLGKVDTVYLSPETGEMQAIRIDQGSLVFERGGLFDVKAFNLEIADHVVRSDLDKKMLKQGQKTKQPDPEGLSLKDILGQPVIVRGTEAGRIVDMLAPSGEMKITHVRIYVKDKKKYTIIPFDTFSYKQVTGQWQAEISQEQWKIIKEYTL